LHSKEVNPGRFLIFLLQASFFLKLLEGFHFCLAVGGHFGPPFVESAYAQEEIGEVREVVLIVQ
jgi:hypothetical protein